MQCAYGGTVWALIELATRNLNISKTFYWALVGLLAFLPVGVSAVATTLKRLHDRNLSSWWLPGTCAIAFLSGEGLNLMTNRGFLEWGPLSPIVILLDAIWQIGRRAPVLPIV